MNTKSPIWIIALGLIAQTSAFAGSMVEELRSMSPDGLVQVENLAGSVEIRAWDKAEVLITGELGDSVEELQIVESSSGLQVIVRNHQNQRNVDESNLQLNVPINASLEVQGVSADISVEGLESERLILESVSGDIEVSAQTQVLEAESISGDVTFVGHTLRASVESVSGEITLQGVEGEFKATTVSGDLQLSGTNINRGRFETVSGDLEIELDLTESGRLKAESMSGDLKLLLPGDQQAEFKARTYSGDISSDFGSAVEKSHGPGSTLSHRAGKNGATISIESFSGDIRIESQ